MVKMSFKLEPTDSDISVWAFIVAAAVFVLVVAAFVVSLVMYR